MSKELVSEWYSKIPEIERDLPIILVDGKVYTPREVYEEVMNGTELGEKMQETLERYRESHSATYDELKTIAEERVKKILSWLPKDFSIVSLSGKVAKGADEIYKAIGDEAVRYEMNNILRIVRL